MKRLFYLDVLRGLAILFMVVDHAFDWWLDVDGHSSLWGQMTEFAGTLAAPMFLFLVGVGLALSYGSAVKRGETPWKITSHFLRRGVLIFLSGYLFNLLIFFTGANPGDIWSIDVLHTIGLSIVLMIPFLWLPASIGLLLTVVIFILAQSAGFWVLPEWLEAFLITGYFPINLWLPYACLGLVFGQVFHQGNLVKRDILILFGLGILGFGLLPFINPGWGYRHPRPIFVLFSLSVLLWLIVITWFWTERMNRGGPVVRTIQEMGRASLMLYVFHHLVGYRLFWLFGWVNGRSWRGEYGIFSPEQVAILFIILVFLMALVSRWWLRQRDTSRRVTGFRPTSG